jgi:hypothetical protein
MSVRLDTRPQQVRVRTALVRRQSAPPAAWRRAGPRQRWERASGGPRTVAPPSVAPPQSARIAPLPPIWRPSVFWREALHCTVDEKEKRVRALFPLGYPLGLNVSQRVGERCGVWLAGVSCQARGVVSVYRLTLTDSPLGAMAIADPLQPRVAERALQEKSKPPSAFNGSAQFMCVHKAHNTRLTATRARRGPGA